MNTQAQLKLVNSHQQKYDRLEKIEATLEGIQIDETNLTQSFELIHRQALKTAGIVIEIANAQRKRPLPMNVWHALKRIGGIHAVRSAEVAPLVAIREKLDAAQSSKNLLTVNQVKAHQEQSLGYVREVIFLFCHGLELVA